MTGSMEPAAGAVAAWSRHASSDVDPTRLRAQLTEGTLPQAFHDVAREAGHKRAVSVEGEAASYAELEDTAGRIAAWLRERGLGREDRVVLCGRNSLGFVLAYLGIVRAGAVVVLAGPDLTERELRHIVVHSGARAAFASADAYGRLASIGVDGRLDPVVALDGQS
ncbi:MAG: AMP-binding protein, partial [Solirubrobacterales bacterium]